MTLDTENELMKTIPPQQPLPPYQLFTEHYTIGDEINFKALCRGNKIRVHWLLCILWDVLITINVFHQNGTLTKNLKCYYKTDNPFLKIKPLKVEVHSDDPPVLQFYEFMPNVLIDRFINITTSDKLRKVPSKIRVASNDYIDDTRDEQFRRIPQMVYEATGHNLLRESSSELLLRTTYGVIGEFVEYNLCMLACRLIE